MKWLLSLFPWKDSPWKDICILISMSQSIHTEWGCKRKNSLAKWGKLKVVFIQSIQSKQAVQSHRQVFWFFVSLNPCCQLQSVQESVEKFPLVLHWASLRSALFSCSSSPMYCTYISKKKRKKKPAKWEKITLTASAQVNDINYIKWTCNTAVAAMANLQCEMHHLRKQKNCKKKNLPGGTSQDLPCFIISHKPVPSHPILPWPCHPCIHLHHISPATQLDTSSH